MKRRIAVAALIACLIASLSLNFFCLDRIDDLEYQIPDEVSDLDPEYRTHVERLQMAMDKIDDLQDRVDTLESKVRYQY